MESCSHEGVCRPGGSMDIQQMLHGMSTLIVLQQSNQWYLHCFKPWTDSCPDRCWAYELLYSVLIWVWASLAAGLAQIYINSKGLILAVYLIKALSLDVAPVGIAWAVVTYIGWFKQDISAADLCGKIEDHSDVSVARFSQTL